MPKVFISYSHDSLEHRDKVLALSERLRADGIETLLDQYVNGSPLQGWPRWMLDQLDAADFVLVVCTETYYRRFRGREEPRKGKGVDWEGALITQEVYDSRGRTVKFVPVILSAAVEEWIPEPIRSHTHYTLTTEDAYQRLYDFLLGQSGVEPGQVGSPRARPRRRGTPLTFDAPAPAALAPAPDHVRLQKAERFREMFASFESSPTVQSARNMLDNSNVQLVELFLAGLKNPGQRVEVTTETVRVALAEEDPDDDPQEATYNAIRGCFDAYFDALEQFDSDISDGLIDEQHVIRKFGYWVRQFADPSVSMKGAGFVRAARQYVEKYYPGEIQSLCARVGCGFPATTDPKPAPSTTPAPISSAVARTPSPAPPAREGGESKGSDRLAEEAGIPSGRGRPCG